MTTVMERAVQMEEYVLAVKVPVKSDTISRVCYLLHMSGGQIAFEDI